MNKQIEKSIELLSHPDSLNYVCRQQEENHPMPSTDVIGRVVQLCRSVIFPGYFGNSDVNPDNVNEHIEQNIILLHQLLTQQIKSGMCFDNSTVDYTCKALEAQSIQIAADFVSQLPAIREILHTDVIAAFDGDPAAKSYGEVIFCYPGIRAISSYRIAHALLKLGVPVIPRIITEKAHSETGIDIHPGAVIGDFFTIDHGTGVVIGETAVIGSNVKMYQGVTLGAKSFPLDENGNPIKGIDRHPKIGNNVIIYANSTILGNIKVGDDSVIGGNIWVDTDVAPGTRLLQRKREEYHDLATGDHASKKKKHKEEEYREEKKRDKEQRHKKEKDREVKDKDEKRKEKVKYAPANLSGKYTMVFEKCTGCKSRNGCAKCRAKWEKKHGKIIQ